VVDLSRQVRAVAQLLDQLIAGATVYHTANGSLEDLINDVDPLVVQYGSEGYEMVNCSVNYTQVASRFQQGQGNLLTFQWSIVIAMKRPELSNLPV